MDTPVTNRTSFIVDPQRDGINNALWKNVTGTPTVAGGKFRFNTQEGLIRADLVGGRVEFVINSVAPTAGQAKQWGLKNLALGLRSKIFFDINGAVFSVNSYDDMGINTFQTVITWDTAWTTTDTLFCIDWFQDRVVFLACNMTTGVKRILASHKIDGSTPPNKVVGYCPLNPYIKNTNGDNLDSAYIVVRRAQESSIMLI